MVVALGLVAVVYGKLTLSDRAEASPPTLADHWHTAYGIYVCDAFLPPFQNSNELINQIAYGIHTHADGVVHIHPFTSAATGNNATLGTFFDAIDVQMTDTTLTVPTATEPTVVAAMPEGNNTLSNGAKCGDQDGRWVAGYWASTADEKPSFTFTDNFNDIRFRDNNSALTLAFVPEGTEIPKPDSIPQLSQLTDIDPTVTTIPGQTAGPTTVPGAITVPGATTLPGDTTVPGATTVPGETTVAGDTTVPGATTVAGDTTTPVTTVAASTTVAPSG